MDTQTPSLTEENTTPAKTLMSWKAPEKPEPQRSAHWYQIAIALAAMLLGYSIYTGSLTFIMVLVIALVIYVYFLNIKPKDQLLEIKENGIVFDGEMIPWFDITGFWIVRTRDYAQLRFQIGGRVHRVLVILTGDNNILDIRTLLRTYAEEFTDRHEKLLDTIIRICKL